MLLIELELLWQGWIEGQILRAGFWSCIVAQYQFPVSMFHREVTRQYYELPSLVLSILDDRPFQILGHSRFHLRKTKLQVAT